MHWFPTRGQWINFKGFIKILFIFKFIILELGDIQLRIKFILLYTIFKTESLNARIALHYLTISGVHVTNLALEMVISGTRDDRKIYCLLKGGVSGIDVTYSMNREKKLINNFYFIMTIVSAIISLYYYL